MGNTTLKRIAIPKLNANFGESIQEVFKAIDLNFQKLANIGLNQGAPGQSCIYLPINLGAAFLYSPVSASDPGAANMNTRFNSWIACMTEIEGTNPSRWKEFKESVDSDYEQFANITGYGKDVYARIAARLLWGDPYLFSDTSNIYPGSMTATLEAKYSNVAGVAEFGEGNESISLYGNWMYELYKVAHTSGGVDFNKFKKMFADHFAITVPGKLVVAFSPIPDGDGLSPVGSFEYWYIDPRFRCGKTDSKTTAGSTDISCVLHWVPKTFGVEVTDDWEGGFEILEIFPTIKTGADGSYYWNINGMDTGVPVNGQDGSDGKAAQLIIVERVENVKGWDPINYPNGKEIWSPKPGKQTIRMLHYSGAPLSVTTEYPNPADNIELPDNASVNPVNARIGNRNLTTLEKMIIEGSSNVTGLTQRVLQFEHNETDAWLPATDDELDEQMRNPSNAQYLHRIFRLVGRTKFWKSNATSRIDPTKDDYNRLYDPAADDYYFGENKGKSIIDEDRAVQTLINELDGAFAIVLPGPSYMGGRTDSTFWFATLKKVQIDSNRCMLVAYCSPYSQCTTQLDEHSYAGLMQGLDPYTFKTSSNNRNKPRGLMLPIGSINAVSETPSNTWAAHIIHSDTGGFSGFTEDRRGYQNVKPSDAIVHGGTTTNGAQFTEVSEKRILHVGSVDDFRTLNFVNQALDDKGGINGAVPGRIKLTGEGSTGTNGVGYSTFFGEYDGQWFKGTELHVDEPVTITSYRDLFAKGILLSVEGDTIIGPTRHVNGPDANHSLSGGGLWVQSTLTLESLNRLNDSPFKNLVKGTQSLTFDPFIHDTAFDEKDKIKRNGAIPESNDKCRPRITFTRTHNPLFSAIFEDTIGARIMAASDGIITYNGTKVTFSVDGEGNIQTYGNEVRSNGDTHWYFHTKWEDKDSNALTIGSHHMKVDGKWCHFFGFEENGNDFDPSTINIECVGTTGDSPYTNSADSKITYMIGDRYIFNGSAYAKGFKRIRHHDCAILFDNGYSSYPAPKHTANGCTYEDAGFTPNEQTPIVLDIGAAYGSRRLVRFGYANTVELNPDYSVKVTEGINDGKGCLFGRYPTSPVQQEIVRFGKFWINASKGTKTVKYPKIFEGMTNMKENPTVVVAQWNADWVNVKLYILCNCWFDAGGGAHFLGIDSRGNADHNASFVAQKTNVKLPADCPKPKYSIDQYWGAMITDCKYTWDNSKGHKEQGGKGYQEKGAKIKGADRIHPGIVIRLQGTDDGDTTQFYDTTEGYAQAGDIIIQQAAWSGMLFAPNRAHREGQSDAPVVCIEFSYANPDNIIEGNITEGSLQAPSTEGGDTGGGNNDDDDDTVPEKPWEATTIDAASVTTFLNNYLFDDIQSSGTDAFRADGTYYSAVIDGSGTKVKIYVDVWKKDAGKVQFVCECNKPGDSDTAVSGVSVIFPTAGV